MSGSSRNNPGQQPKVDNSFRSDLERAHSDFTEIGIIEGIENFRSDLEEIYIDEISLQATQQEKRRWIIEATKGLKRQAINFRRLEWGLNLFNILQIGWALLSLFLSVSIMPMFGISQMDSTVFGVIVAIFVFLLDFGMPYGKTLIQTVGYENISIRLAPESVNFRAAWNKGVVNSPTCVLGIMIVSLLGVRKSSGYFLALRGIRMYVRWVS